MSLRFDGRPGDDPMKPETVALLGGLLLLLIAIVGGGFTNKEIIMPGVPSWARMASCSSAWHLLCRISRARSTNVRAAWA
jgi:hypothetical protein